MKENILLLALGFFIGFQLCKIALLDPCQRLLERSINLCDELLERMKKFNEDIKKHNEDMINHNQIK